MDAVYRGVNGLGRLALRALDVRVHAHGLENLPSHGPVVLAANHVSFVDFIMIEKAAVERGRYVRFMTRYDIWDSRPVGWAMDRMRHVPVDRRIPADAYLRARNLLRSGEAVGVFPEAGISYSFTIRSMMRGAVALARETGVPLVPVAIWGSQRLHTVGVPEPAPDLTRGRRVDVTFGAPRHLAATADLVTETSALGEVLTEMVEDLQLMPEHRPRPGEYATWYPAHLGGHAPTRTEAMEYDVLPSSAVKPTWGPAWAAAESPAQPEAGGGYETGGSVESSRV